MAKIYIRKINELLDSGELKKEDLESYIDENIPSRWQKEVKEYFINL